MTTDLAELLRQVDPSVVGQRVRAAREVFAVPLRDLADAIGLDSAALDELERGIRTPDLAVLSAVADATATSAELLVTGLSRDVLADLQGDLDLAGFTLSSQDSSAARATAERILEQLDAAGATAPHLDRAARRLRAKALEASGDLAEAIDELRRVTAVPVAEVAWVEDLISLSRCYRETLQIDEMIAVGERASGPMQELGLADTTVAIQLTVTGAVAHMLRGDLGQCARVCLRAAAHAERLGLAAAKGSALWNAGVAKQAAGDLPAALELVTAALELLEPDGDSRRIGMLRAQVASIQLDLEEADPRIALDLLALAGQELDWAGAGAIQLARHRLNTARAHHALGDDEEALRVLHESEDFAPADAIDIRAWQLMLRARIAARLRDVDGALASLHAATHLLTTCQADDVIALAWFRLGAAFEELDELGLAADAFHRACIAQGLRPQR
ncbi:hypothetical protein GUY44_17500 [Pimelobacter simplex]|uniref:Uncharacterized protein n=1 Tax=Nocardioides simplex TaxID=2045 RepID=A0A0A1DQ83_NOCSI|nr:helix-turn-helix transcriptional regulator [Pimelobacter simplex]AIY18728.1 hypothetical protein KR76_21630 [Pimelobacter simplex]MCG8152288.1 hypothetical protein [Pimelobacter simplex]GEB14403.1 hypothetical protein NSI01_27180 [Pimelobacter simplex]SFM30091.1 hypothetical protein SAMN05421671_1018 [Pimelobacter simplex]